MEYGESPVQKVGYIRTSLDRINVANQMKQLNDMGIPDELIFVDAARSGATNALERKGFGKMIEFLRYNKDPAQDAIVYTTEISRVGRGFRDTFTTIIALDEEGILVHSLSPNESWLNTTERKMRDLLLAIFSWVAQMERETLRERTRQGMKRAQAEGAQLGRPKREIPWGDIDEMRGKELPWTNISRILDIPYATLMKKKKDRELEMAKQGL